MNNITPIVSNAQQKITHDSKSSKLVRAAPVISRCQSLRYSMIKVTKIGIRAQTNNSAHHIASLDTTGLAAQKIKPKQTRHENSAITTGDEASDGVSLGRKTRNRLNNTSIRLIIRFTSLNRHQQPAVLYIQALDLGITVCLVELLRPIQTEWNLKARAKASAGISGGAPACSRLNGCGF